MNSSVLEPRLREIKDINLPYLSPEARKTIPKLMLDCPQWITWQDGERDTSGKLPKKPYGKDGTSNAWQKSNQHMTFEEAISTASLTFIPLASAHPSPLAKYRLIQNTTSATL